jgi:copper transport protein
VQAEPLIRWPQPITEYLGFVASFLAAGAIGFRYAVARAAVATPGAPGAVDARVYADSRRRAAILGLVGVVLGAVLATTALPGLAARRHLTVAQLVTGDFLTGSQLILLALAAAGLALAAGRRDIGWPLAAFGVVAGALRALFVGRWAQLVNPIHVLAAGLWLGTLFVLVVAGLATALRDEPSRERRGALVAEMVNAFSPLALAMGGVVVLFGVLTAWRHLKTLPALWTTPYGYALIVKLCVVAAVFALGAWNWRRQRPALGTEDAALRIRRSATAELTAAALVLAVTAVLVSLPAPREGAPSAGPPPGTPGRP